MNGIANKYLLLCGLAIGCSLTSVRAPAQSEAFGNANCQSGQSVSVDFDNGAGWRLCVDNRARENLVLTQVRYKNSDGVDFPILASAGISQLHVAYDDSNVTYNDVTQYGLGATFMLELTEADCPNGVLLNHGNQLATCVTEQAKGSAHRTQNRRLERESLNVFSVSQVGAYTYVLDWTLHDDGTLEPAVGATGALQRSSSVTEQPFGRTLSEDADTQWLSHTHNYYWRLDFDLGDSATDDVATETSTSLTSAGQRVTQTTTFNTEQARRIDPASFQTWHVFEHVEANVSTSDNNAAPRGYHIAPQRHGHRMTRKEVEPYTDYDFFVTVASDCERFASDNALFYPECTNHVLDFANDESLVNQDIVLWHRVAFHHVPRNEDQRHMHAHWDSFEMTPVNISGYSPGAANVSNQAPVVTPIDVIVATVGEPLNVQLSASDADGDGLHFHAISLPSGLALSHNGVLSGTPLQGGEFETSITVSDDIASVTINPMIRISGHMANSGDSDSKGFFGAMHPLLWLLILCLTLTRGHTRGSTRDHLAVRVSQLVRITLRRTRMPHS